MWRLNQTRSEKKSALLFQNFRSYSETYKPDGSDGSLDEGEKGGRNVEKDNLCENYKTRSSEWRPKHTSGLGYSVKFLPAALLNVRFLSLTLILTPSPSPTFSSCCPLISLASIKADLVKQVSVTHYGKGNQRKVALEFTQLLHLQGLRDESSGRRRSAPSKQ